MILFDIIYITLILSNIKHTFWIKQYYNNSAQSQPIQTSKEIADWFLSTKKRKLKTNLKFYNWITNIRQLNRDARSNSPVR